MAGAGPHHRPDSASPRASSPEPTPAGGPADSSGDPAVDAVLEGLEGAEDLAPAEEIEAYRTALDALGRLLEEQPRMPGLP